MQCWTTACKVYNWINATDTVLHKLWIDITQTDAPLIRKRLLRHPIQSWNWIAPQQHFALGRFPLIKIDWYIKQVALRVKIHSKTVTTLKWFHFELSYFRSSHSPRLDTQAACARLVCAGHAQQSWWWKQETVACNWPATSCWQLLAAAINARRVRLITFESVYCSFLF